MNRILNLGLAIVWMFGLLNVICTGSADSIGPEITNVYHIPKYPIYNENVTVYATVTDPDGVQTVKIMYCDEFLCYVPIFMQRMGTSDVFYGIIPFLSGWGNGSIVGYKINATDALSNEIETDYLYYFYVSEIEMNSELVDTAYVGETKYLTGNATYNGNESAPVEFSNVTVRIKETGTDYFYETDINGEFSIPIEFLTYGELFINITISNRTLLAHDEKTVFVTGISLLSVNIQTTSLPEQEIWVNGTSLYNTGEPVANSDVTIFISEQLVWYGITDSKGNYSILISAPNEVGPFNVIASIQNGTLTMENTTTITVTEVPIADLIVRDEDLSFSSEKNPPLEGNKINITAIIHNLGTADCTDVAVHFYKGFPSTENIIGSHVITRISVGQVKTAYITWNATNGTNNIVVVADPDNMITESFETNNKASILIFVDADTDSDGIGNLEDEDDDGDGLSDIKEEEMGTDPLNWDTDGDDVSDLEDYDPLDPEVSSEPSEMPLILMILAIVVVTVIIITLVFFKWKKGHKKS